MKRDYPERPLLGVGAIIVRNELILVVRRAQPPLEGEWSIPGGLVETGETTREAVIREIQEETGLAIEPLERVEVFERIVRGPNSGVQYHFVVIDYLCRIVSGEARPGSDVSQMRWAGVDELEGLAVAPETRDVIHKALSIAKKTTAFRTGS